MSKERYFRCIKSYQSGIWLTKGKTYTENNGVFKYDDGYKDTTWIYEARGFGIEMDLMSDYLVEIKEEKEEIKVNKFKVGDSVRILDGSKIKDYTFGFAEDMKQNIGKITTVSSIETRCGKYGYLLEGMNGVKYNCLYDERGLELVKEYKELLSKSITITTSDSTTTITDGTHTTSINRYYTDKHNERNTVSIVINKYYDELAEIDRVSKMPKVGDKVRVVDRNQAYPNYYKFFFENKINDDCIMNWNYNTYPRDHSEFKVVFVGKHSNKKDTVVLVANDSETHIVNVEGLEVVR